MDVSLVNGHLYQFIKGCHLFLPTALTVPNMELLAERTPVSLWFHPVINDFLSQPIGMDLGAEQVGVGYFVPATSLFL